MRSSAIFLVVLAVCLCPLAVRAAASHGVPGGSRGFLWEIRGPKGHLYVLGRLHVVDGKVYPVHPRIKNTFDASDMLAVGMNLSNPADVEHARQSYVTAGQYPSGDGLKAHVRPETYAAVQEALRFLSVDPHELDQARPWLAREALEEMALRTAGFDAKYILEGPFVKLAQQGQKDIVEIMPIDEKVQLAESVGDDTNDRLLRFAAEEATHARDDIVKRQEAWIRGDLKEWTSVEEASLARHPEIRPVIARFRKKLATAAARYFTDFLESGRTCFVIFDPELLLGPDGVLHQLEAKGYSVTAR